MNLARKIGAAYQKDGLEVIHFLRNCFPCGALPIVGSWFAGIPIRISDIHGEPRDPQTLSTVQRQLAWIEVRSVTHVRAMSRQLAQQLEVASGVPRRKIRVICSGISLDRCEETALRLRSELRISSDISLVTVVARLSPEKGHQVLLRAMAEMKERLTSVRILFVGDGPLRSSLEEQVIAHGLQDIVRFLGFRTDIPDILQVSKFIVLPSLTECMPLALLEAMAAGKPIVASNVGGVGEVVIHDVTGVLVRPGDHHELGRALQQLLTASDEMLKAMGLAARHRAQKYYSTEQMLAGIFGLYTRN